MKKTLLTTVAVAALSANAFAIEAGKMYLKGDAGYQMSNYKNKILGDTGSKRLKGFSGDIGFGYALSDDVRTDMTFNFSRGKGKQKADPLGTADIVYTPASGTATTLLAGRAGKAGAVTATEKNIGILFNGYYDFHNSSAFTPYVMAGLGVNRGKLDLKFAGKATKESKEVDDNFTIKSDNKTSFAYQVGFGTFYELSKDVLLDVGYRLAGHKAKYKFKFKDGEEFKFGADTFSKDNPYKPSGSDKNIIQHTVTAGVVFAF